MNVNVETYLVSSDAQYDAAMSVRRAVFVEEQKIPSKYEFDGNDHCASHILAVVDEKPIGTMRIRYFKDFVKFERMCVLPQYRKFDVSDKIMQKAFDLVAQKGYDKVYGFCKKELLKRWAKNGFEPIQGAACVEQNNMTLVPIMRMLPVAENTISVLTPFEILNAREGTWFEQKMLNEPVSTDFHEKMQQLFSKVKRIKASSKQCIAPNKSALKSFKYPADEKSY